MQKRTDLLCSLKDKTYDITVVGGGVIGASIGYIASRAGLKVLIIDKNDFASGASSKTNKIISGVFDKIGKLKKGPLVQLLKERRRIMKKSSSDPIGIFSLTYDYKNLGMFRQEMKVLFYEALAFFSPPKMHKIHSTSTTIGHFPSLINNDMTGSIEYYESSIDDARYTLELLFEAERSGADIINHAELTAFDYDINSIKKLLVADKSTRRVYEVNTKNTIVAAGHWSHDINVLLPKSNCFKNKNVYVKGTQIYLDTKYLDIKKALMLPPTYKDSSVYIIPWKENTLVIGNTLKKYTKKNTCIHATSDEVEYLLDVYNLYFNAPVNKHNIITTQSSLVPEDKSYFNVQKHPSYNYYTIDGGSFTMSGHIAHTALKMMFPNVLRWNRTDTIMHKKTNEKVDWILPESTLNFLYSYYGYINLALRVNEMCKKDASLLEFVGNDDRIPRGLIHYFVKKEHACHLDDVMSRRLRFILTENDCATLLSEQIAQEMASILNWDENRKESEIKRYRTEIKKNRISLF